MAALEAVALVGGDQGAAGGALLDSPDGACGVAEGIGAAWVGTGGGGLVTGGETLSSGSGG